VPLDGDLPEQPLKADGRTGLMRDPAGKVVHASYVLTDGSVDIGGRAVARDERKGFFLYRIDGPLRQVSRVEGLYVQDTWSGPHVTYTRLGCRGGSLTVTLQSDPGLFTKPQTVVARVGGQEVARASVAPRETRMLTVPLRGSGHTCVADFDISPTAIPAVVTKGGNPDPRELGIHFDAFVYKP
jgi:hypothetical protein